MCCLSGYEDFPVAQTVKKSACYSGDQSSIPGSGRSPGGGYGNPPVFLPGESHGQRSRTGYSPWGQKELDTTEQLTQASGYYLCYVNDSFETFCIVSGHINWGSPFGKQSGSLPEVSLDNCLIH